MPKALKNALVDGGLEFIHRSATEFASEPRYSLLHFATGVELVIKARLVHEHWSLVLEKPGAASIDVLRSGAKMTVGMSEAITRLEKCIDPAPSRDFLKSIDRVSKHRNKLVHFAGIGSDNAALLKVAGEQCVAWHHLSELCKHKWQPAFGHIAAKIDKIDGAMREHRTFLDVRFKAIKDQIPTALAFGQTVHECDACGCRSCIHQKDDNIGLTRNCLVCHLRDSGILVECPNDKCGLPLYFTPELRRNESCDDCGEDIGFDVLAPLLGVKEKPVAWCSQCGVQPEETVYQKTNGHGFLCLCCLEPHGDVGTCDYCGDTSAGGDLEHSYLMGCAACDGRGDKD